MKQNAMIVSLLAAALFVVGCDSAPRRMSVSGTVTFKGAPLKEGTITFIPLTSTTQEGAAIVEGRYTLPAENGLSPGMYRVSISSIDAPLKSDPKKPPAASGGVSKERIPGEYNEVSKEEVKVNEAGQNRFDFKIP